MSTDKPSNVLVFGAKKPQASAQPAQSDRVVTVDQDPTHTDKTYSQVLFHPIPAISDEEVVSGVTAVRSAYIKLSTAEAPTLPMLVLKNQVVFPGEKDQPTDELRSFRKRVRLVVDTYFGRENKISKRINERVDEFCMDVRRGMFDNIPGGTRLVDSGTLHFDIWICEFGAQTQSNIAVADAQVRFEPRVDFFSTAP